MERQRVESTGQETNFEALVTPHIQALTALAWRFTHNTATAQDLVQDTLLKAYRFFHRFEIGTNLWAWLLTIMRNLYFTQVRKRAREAVAIDIDHIALFAKPSLMDEPDLTRPEDLTAMLPHLVTDDVLQALYDVPEEYRTAVLLADLLEYSYKEIAVAMDCPIGTVMSRLYRGRQLLQKHLQQYAVAQGYVRMAEDTPVDKLSTAPKSLMEELVYG